MCQIKLCGNEKRKTKMAIVGRDDGNAVDSAVDEAMAGTERIKRATTPHAQQSSEVMPVIKKGMSGKQFSAGRKGL